MPDLDLHCMVIHFLEQLQYLLGWWKRWIHWQEMPGWRMTGVQKILPMSTQSDLEKLQSCLKIHLEMQRGCWSSSWLQQG